MNQIALVSLVTGVAWDECRKKIMYNGNVYFMITVSIEDIS